METKIRENVYEVRLSQLTKLFERHTRALHAIEDLESLYEYYGYTDFADALSVVAEKLRIGFEEASINFFDSED